MQGLIPQTFIDSLLQQTDIVEYIDSFVPLKKQGTSHVACCPFHAEKNPSFNVVDKKQFYHCFGCGASGNVISFAMNYQHLSFPDAIETLATRAGMAVPRDNHPEKYNQALDLYQLLSRVSLFYQQTLKSSGSTAIDYLKKRQVSGEVAKRYQIGYAPPGWHTLESSFKPSKKELITTGMLIQKDDGTTYDRYRQRIMFPLHDRHGRIIGFGGRAIEADQKPKYLNSPETVIFQKNRELYGLHQILQQKNITQVLIVEGYMDVIALAQHGIMNAAATLGTATSTYHIQLLSKHTQDLVFCFDGDAAGRQAAWRALESCLPYLNAGLNAGFVFLPEGHDPDSLVREEGLEHFSARIKNATPLNQFFYQTLTQDIDHASLAGKSQLVFAAKPYLLKMTDGPYQQLMVDALARLTRIESHRINQLLQEKTPEITPDTQENISRTPLRIATALLLQNPEIYANCCEHAHPHMLNEQRQQVLQTLMQKIAENPTINTASLVESWRDTPLFESMNKLAAWDHQVPEDALTTEFTDIVLFLSKQNQDNIIQELIQKSRQGGLTKTDQHTLQNMLKQRHNTTPNQN